MTDSSSNSSQPIEYSIFTQEFSEEKDKPASLEKQQVTEDMDAAIKDAETLFASGKYLKVEVKKKYFEEKTGRTIEMTLRAFEGKEKKDYGIALAIIAAVLCGAAAFGITFIVF